MKHTLNSHFLLTFCAIICYNPINLQGQDCKGQINVHPIRLKTKEIAGLNFLDSITFDRNLFFVSEAHGNPYSQAIQQKLISYLASNVQLQWIAIEADYAHGCALNQFLETGDVGELKNFLKFQPDFTAFKHINYIANLQELKYLHDSLGFKFKFIGIDVCKEGFKGSVFTVMNYLKDLDSSEQFEPILFRARKLMNRKNIGYGNMKKWITLIKTDLPQIEISFKNAGYEDKYAHLKNILYNLSQSIEIRSRKPVNRELQIANNFKLYIKPDDFVYCQFGYGHVLTNRWPEIGDSGKSFVDWLETSENYKNRSVIFAFSPHIDDSPEFALFGDSLCPDFKTEIIKSKFPVIVDFRRTTTFSNQFQFVFIIEE